MNKKQFAAYAAEMDEKFHVVQESNKQVNEIRTSKIKNADERLLDLVEALKEDLDLRIFKCQCKPYAVYNHVWFDIYIPKYKLYIKLCDNKVDKDLTYISYRHFNIQLFVLTDETHTVDYMIEQIIQKIAKIGEMEGKK